MRTTGRLWRVLIGLALITCIASLFGSAERWWGVDVGAVGSALLHPALIPSTVVACVRPRSLFPEALAQGSGAVESDERDLRLRHAADRVGDWALIFIVVAGVVLLMGVPAPRLEWWLEPMVLANVLIAVLVVKAQVESVALVAHYAHSRR